MIDIRGLWENFPITATILGVAGIISFIIAIVKNNECDEIMEVSNEDF